MTDEPAGEVIALPRKSITMEMATRYGMDHAAFELTMRATVFPPNGTREQFAAFLMVARAHDLNPFTKEIFAFPTKHGGIVPVVSVDGWLKLCNGNPQMNGLVFEDQLDADNNLIAVKARIYRKDRAHPIEVTEYMKECRRDTDTWRQWPARMLRHKATIQAGRYAFGFAGIYDIDEAERMYSIHGAGLSPGEGSDIETHPGDDTSGQFLNGEVADLLVASYAAQFEAAPDVAAMEKVMASFRRRYYNKTRKRISSLLFDGIEEMYARIEERKESDAFDAHQAEHDITAHVAAKTKPATARRRRSRVLRKRVTP